jgi:GNAT superfamily N-acetyltransferase
MDTRVTIEDPRSPISSMLIAELADEVAALYPDSHNGNGSSAFAGDANQPRSVFIVARDGDLALGCGELCPTTDPDVAAIKRMYVRSEERGKGIARVILAALESAAQEFGYRKLILEIGMRQPQAIALYESSGYQRTIAYGVFVNEPLSICYEKVL